MKKKFKLTWKLLFIIMFCYIFIRINAVGVSKDKCLICNSIVYENTNFFKIRTNCIGILYINSGVIDELRLYELDQHGNKIDFYGYINKNEAYNIKNGSYGVTIIKLDEMKSYSNIKLGRKHKPLLSYMSNLYCKEHIKEIMSLSTELDIVLIDFETKILYSLESINQNINIRNYNINVSKNSEEIDINVIYNE